MKLHHRIVRESANSMRKNDLCDPEVYGPETRTVEVTFYKVPYSEDTAYAAQRVADSFYTQWISGQRLPINCAERMRRFTDGVKFNRPLRVPREKVKKCLLNMFELRSRTRLVFVINPLDDVLEVVEGLQECNIKTLRTALAILVVFNDH